MVIYLKTKCIQFMIKKNVLNVSLHNLSLITFIVRSRYFLKFAFYSIWLFMIFFRRGNRWRSELLKKGQFSSCKESWNTPSMKQNLHFIIVKQVEYPNISFSDRECSEICRKMSLQMGSSKLCSVIDYILPRREGMTLELKLLFHFHLFHCQHSLRMS